MISHIVRSTLLVGFALILAATTLSDGRVKQRPTVQETPPSAASDVERDAQKMIQEGREIFRFDTCRDEEFWGDALKLHQAIPQTGVDEAEVDDLAEYLKSLETGEHR